MCVCDSLLLSSHRNAPLEFSKLDVQALPRNEVALRRNWQFVTQIRTFATALGAKRCLREREPPNVHPALEAHEVVVGWHLGMNRLWVCFERPTLALADCASFLERSRCSEPRCDPDQAPGRSKAAPHSRTAPL